MTFGSICSGIEAASVAWHPLGWKPAWFAEIDAFPSAVLAHHYPEVRNYGDFTGIGVDAGPIDVLVGGTPCQSFSVAGLRKGLDDERGNLTLEFLRLAGRLRPRWLVWENVPGVLSIDGGRTFGTFLGGLGELGYGFAYRVLDAQYFGVPQRRRRVFVVGCLGDWHAAAAVLFERHSLQGHPAPRREAGQDVTGTIGARTKSGGGVGGDFECAGGVQPVAMCLNAGAMKRQDAESETLIAHALRGEGFDASEDGTGRGTPLVPVAFSCKDHGADAGEIAPTLRSMGHAGSHANAGGQVAVAFKGDVTPKYSIEVVGTLRREQGGEGDCVVKGMSVRRLTPVECERLQGFPDNYTAIPYRGKPAADGPRYKALGNSMAVPVMAWIGQRIDAVNSIMEAACR